MQRRLAAILAADVVGYSRQLGADEAGTLARLSALRERVLNPLPAQHGGRLFKSMGDGFLAEFSSAVQALRCALTIQSRQAGRRAAGDEPLEVRIGLHQGAVVVEGEDLFGDGVNIATRLEPLAPAGEICISAPVRINGQLIEAATDRHIWADCFDGDQADICDLQDRTAGSIVGTVEPSPQRVQINRASMKSTENLDGYDFYVRALSQNVLARRSENDVFGAYTELLVSLDPNCIAGGEKPNWAAGYRAIILALPRLGRLHEAREAANRLLAIDPNYRLASLNIPFRGAAFADELKSASRAAGIPD